MKITRVLASLNKSKSVWEPGIFQSVADRDCFADTAALISIVSNCYYGMLRGQIYINLPPEHPKMSFKTIEIQMATISAKRSMAVCQNNTTNS